MFKVDDIFLKRVRAYLFFAVIFLFVFALGVKNNALDCDLWARLANGQHVFFHFFPLKNDIYSFAPVHNWYDPEWISSAFIYWIQKCFGVVGLTCFKIISFFLLICVLIFILFRLKAKNTPINLFYFILFSLISSQVGYLSYSARCQIFTFIIFALWLYILERTRKDNSKLFYILPLIMIFWQNVHGGCISGIGTLFIYFVGETLNKKPSLKYLIMFFSLILTLVISPWGVDYYGFLLKSSYIDRSFITEWKPLFNYINLQGNLFFFFLIISYLGCIYKLFKAKKANISFDKTQIIMIILISYLSISHLKHIMLAMIAITIYLYDDILEFFGLIIEKIKTKIIIKEKVLNFLKKFILCIFYFAIFLYSLMVLCVYPLKESYKNQVKLHYPIYAMEFLKQNNIKGKIITSFQVASFVGYKYYPDYKIFVDGRQEQVYESSTVDEILDFIDQTGKNPNKILDIYQPDIVLLEQNSIPAIQYMNQDKRYSMIYMDNYFLVYVLNKYKKNTNDYIIPDKNNKNYFIKLFDTNIDFAKDT